MADEAAARRSFEVANDIVPLDPALDDVYTYDAAEYQQLLRAAPWRQDAEYFQRVRISAIALIKMVLHTRAGGAMEVMGLMQGKACARTRTIYVMDAFALPVQGTETRVNAQNEAYEYMVDYLDKSPSVGRPENAIGWYHSHPGYGCWLSGIDVQTQKTNQQQDPFVAVVIDPNRTMTAGQVEIGAFRTYPDGHQADASRARQSVPTSKLDDYGAHANEYYPLSVQYFKSSLDARLFELLWHRYWTHALAQSPSRLQRAVTQRAEEELAEKLRLAGATLSSYGAGTPLSSAAREASRADAPEDAQQQLAAHLARRAAEQPLAQAARDAARLAAEARHGYMGEALKHALFGGGAPARPYALP